MIRQGCQIGCRDATTKKNIIHAPVYLFILFSPFLLPKVFKKMYSQTNESIFSNEVKEILKILTQEITSNFQKLENCLV